jgi:hypothetical protein
MRPICRIIDFRDEFQRKRIRQEDYDYKYQLSKAFENNRRLNLSVPSFSPNSSFNSNDYKNDIQQVIQESIYTWPIEFIAHKCFPSAFEAQRILKEKMNIDSLFTLGSFSHKNDKVKIYYESFTKLKYRLRHKDYNTLKIPLHAWLTMDDYHIIDPSLLSTLKSQGQFPELDYRQFNFLNGLTQANEENLYRYHPILVGDEFLFKTGFIKNILLP